MPFDVLINLFFRYKDCTGQICYSTEVNQFLNWLTETVNRTVSLNFSNLAIVFQNKRTSLRMSFYFGGTGQI